MDDLEMEENKLDEKEMDELTFDEETLCPNCSQNTEGETTCPHCGAILPDEEDEFNGFQEEDGM